MASNLNFSTHHVGYLVSDIAQAVPRFTDRLDYRVESGIIEDPVQTAYVQFLRQPGALEWMELIAPTGESSKLTRALRQGGGLHHLCYEVNDMDRACAHLRDHEMLALSAPVPAAAFPGRRIAWFMDRFRGLVELLEQGDGALSLNGLRRATGHAGEPGAA